jgi:hypothetical protein
MKVFIGFVGVLFLCLAAIATPVAIGLGLYDWVVADHQFKLALWYGFKVWVCMVGAGLVVGYPCFVIGATK